MDKLLISVVAILVGVFEGFLYYLITSNFDVAVAVAFILYFIMYADLVRDLT